MACRALFCPENALVAQASGLWAQAKACGYQGIFMVLGVPSEHEWLVPKLSFGTRLTMWSFSFFAENRKLKTVTSAAGPR
jgi:hypothetical protein